MTLCLQTESEAVTPEASAADLKYILGKYKADEANGYEGATLAYWEVELLRASGLIQ